MLYGPGFNGCGSGDIFVDISKHPSQSKVQMTLSTIEILSLLHTKLFDILVETF